MCRSLYIPVLTRYMGVGVRGLLQECVTDVQIAVETIAETNPPP